MIVKKRSSLKPKHAKFMEA
jgi:hypothetical protein